MKARMILALLLAAAGPVRASGVSGKYKDYNVVLISMTNLGANHMSLYGYSRKTTPKLDEWARDAVVFDNAFAHASWTLPASTSLMSSMYPYSHRVWRRDRNNSLPKSVETLPEVLVDHGYVTAAFTGALDYSKHFSQLRGFQFKSDNPDFSGFPLTLKQASEWLAQYSDRKFMLLIQGYDLHCPFHPVPPYKGTFADEKLKSPSLDPALCVRGYKNETGAYRAFYSGGCPYFRKKEVCLRQGEEVTLTQGDIDYLAGLYDDKVLEVDALVSGFLASLAPKVRDRTIIVVMSDHGEMFAKHGRFGRAGTRRGTHYDDVLHIPLMIRFPGEKPARIDGLVQTIDIMPTILDALGVPLPKTAQGKSMAPLLEGKAAINDYVYSGMPYNTMLKQRITAMDKKLFEHMNIDETVRDRHWKLMREQLIDPESPEAPAQSRLELYDVAADPEELRDVSAAHPEIVADLKAKLQAWSRRAMAAYPGGDNTEEIPADIVRRARERGYWQ